jgi:type II secretory pathway pseudopilin PulG
MKSLTLAALAIVLSATSLSAQTATTKAAEAHKEAKAAARLADRAADKAADAKKDAMSANASAHAAMRHDASTKQRTATKARRTGYPRDRHHDERHHAPDDEPRRGGERHGARGHGQQHARRCRPRDGAHQRPGTRHAPEEAVATGGTPAEGPAWQHAGPSCLCIRRRRATPPDVARSSCRMQTRSA